MTFFGPDSDITQHEGIFQPKKDKKTQQALSFSEVELSELCGVAAAAVAVFMQSGNEPPLHLMHRLQPGGKHLAADADTLNSPVSPRGDSQR